MGDLALLALECGEIAGTSQLLVVPTALIVGAWDYLTSLQEINKRHVQYRHCYHRKRHTRYGLHVCGDRNEVLHPIRSLIVVVQVDNRCPDIPAADDDLRHLVLNNNVFNYS